MLYMPSSGEGYGSLSARGLHVHPAADVDRLTRDVAGEVAREEGSYVSYVLRCTATAERDLYFPLLANFFRERTRHIGDDEARAIALARTPRAPSSFAMLFARPIIPALEAE